MAEDTVSLKTRLYRLYYGGSRQARLFHFALLAFDIAAITYFALSLLWHGATWTFVVDAMLAVVIGLDFSARLWIAPVKRRYFLALTTWADIVVIVTLVYPVLFESFLFLRILRALRILRSYHLLRLLRQDVAFFRRNEELINSLTNLLVFIFVVTGMVYVLQLNNNPEIRNYVDALYFTVSTLTTTGFGDITLKGAAGRLLAVVIMVAGVGLFLRLLQTIFRPPKVHHECPDCGLSRHDTDAVHCKHCGRLLNIETEGQD